MSSINAPQAEPSWFGVEDNAWMEKKIGNLLVAATLIAAMSFELMVNPPGGVVQSSEKSNFELSGICHSPGTSVFACNEYVHLYYLGMTIASNISFSTSLALILIVVSGMGYRCLRCVS